MIAGNWNAQSVGVAHLSVRVKDDFPFPVCHFPRPAAAFPFPRRRAFTHTHMSTNLQLGGDDLRGGHWVTINGARIYIKDGEAVAGAAGHLAGEKSKAAFDASRGAAKARTGESHLAAASAHDAASAESAKGGDSMAADMHKNLADNHRKVASFAGNSTPQSSPEHSSAIKKLGKIAWTAAKVLGHGAAAYFNPFTISMSADDPSALILDASALAPSKEIPGALEGLPTFEEIPDESNILETKPDGTPVFGTKKVPIAYYSKEVIRVPESGKKWTNRGLTKLHGEPVEFNLTTQDLDDAVANFKDAQAAGITPFIPDTHSERRDAAKNNGSIIGLERRGGSLFSKMKVVGSSGMEKVMKNDVSVMLVNGNDQLVMDAYGKQYKGYVLHHVALTPNPNQPHLQPFQRIAASADAIEQDVPVYEYGDAMELDAENEGRWVTMNGSHVQIDEHGIVAKGAANLIGKSSTGHDVRPAARPRDIMPHQRKEIEGLQGEIAKSDQRIAQHQDHIDNPTIMNDPEHAQAVISAESKVREGNLNRISQIHGEALAVAKAKDIKLKKQQANFAKRQGVPAAPATAALSGDTPMACTPEELNMIKGHMSEQGEPDMAKSLDSSNAISALVAHHNAKAKANRVSLGLSADAPVSAITPAITALKTELDATKASVTAKEKELELKTLQLSADDPAKLSPMTVSLTMRAFKTDHERVIESGVLSDAGMKELDKILLPGGRPTREALMLSADTSDPLYTRLCYILRNFPGIKIGPGTRRVDETVAKTREQLALDAEENSDTKVAPGRVAQILGTIGMTPSLPAAK